MRLMIILLIFSLAFQVTSSLWHMCIFETIKAPDAYCGHSIKCECGASTTCHEVISHLVEQCSCGKQRVTPLQKCPIGHDVDICHECRETSHAKSLQYSYRANNEDGQERGA
ncbi:hypothetical protein O181_060787 [Austropuccinia psidii MF-1]|uniref:Uncharacterized protein n=1 Tax=Austropuccinia psidii MF-1 TaxID=1389203 RepID=A0A9Q3EP78_9BASI|nr:hypothetical protein [Austropuccinia psidii MF-1]